jgi:hypothetical protein
MNCPHCKQPLPAGDPGTQCPHCGAPADDAPPEVLLPPGPINWWVFIIVLFAPTVAMLILGNVPSAIAVRVGCIAGIVCGTMLGITIGRTILQKILLALFFVPLLAFLSSVLGLIAWLFRGHHSI